jgi:hypothetical protein
MISLTSVVGGRFAFENHVPRIVSLGDDADQFFAVHHDQRTDVLFSHLCQGIEYRSIRSNGPKIPALLLEYVSYRHVAPAFQLLGVRHRLPDEVVSMPLNYLTLTARYFDLGQYDPT